MSVSDLRANKAKLTQARSRETRRKIVKSALQLWKRHGFEEGFDTVTVDDIADNAGVSRATVYYYFPKKEEILKELAWVTADEIYECALRSMMGGKPVEDVLNEVMGQLGEKVSRSPVAAVKRMLQLRNDDPEELTREGSMGLTRAFSVVIAHAQELGEVPKTISSVEVGDLLASIAMGCINKWSMVGGGDLVNALQRRAALILAGARSIGQATAPATSKTKLA